MSQDLYSFLNGLLTIKDDLGSRLKAARRLLGLNQTDMSALGKVSRVTQLKYESGLTEPTTRYLRDVQSAGLDIPYVLFGVQRDQVESNLPSASAIDWQVMQQAYEDVDFFCLKCAPQCPPRYRWKMVAELYSVLIVRKSSAVPANASLPEPFQIVAGMWLAYGNA